MTDSQGNFVDILKNKPLGSGASQQREKPEGVWVGPRLSGSHIAFSVPMILGSTGQWACL